MNPLVVGKGRDIVGLLLNPPNKVMVLCIEEGTQIQALDRTHPLLPMGLAYVEDITLNHIRQGSINLSA